MRSDSSVKWREFSRRYTIELARCEADIAMLRERAQAGTLTLLYAVRDTAHNNAVVLKHVLEGTTSKDGSRQSQA